MRITNRTTNYILAHTSFLVLAFMAVFYYLQRTLTGDCPWYIFNMINHQGFEIVHGRFTNVFVQIIPVLAINAGFSLKAVLICFSISYIIFYYSIFLLCFYVLKHKVAAWTVLLGLIISVSHLFWSTVSEVQLGLVFAAVLLAWLEWPQIKSRMLIRILGSFIIIAFCYFSHPMTVFLIFFALAYVVIKSNNFKDYSIYIIAGIALALFAFKAITIGNNDYESGQLAELKNFKEHIFNLKNIYSTYFYMHRVKLFVINNILLVIVIFNYLINKKWLLLLFFSGFVSAFMLITLITYSMGDSDIMMEKNFLPLSFFILVPFLEMLFNKEESYQMKANVLLAGMIGFSLLRIHENIAFYSAKLDYYDKILYSMKDSDASKFILIPEKINGDKIGISWAVALETLYYSTIKDPSHSKTFYIMKEFDDEAKLQIENPDLFLCVHFWPYWKIDDLNSRYFKLKSEKYSIVEQKID